MAAHLLTDTDPVRSPSVPAPRRRRTRWTPALLRRLLRETERAVVLPVPLVVPDTSGVAMAVDESVRLLAVAAGVTVAGDTSVTTARLVARGVLSPRAGEALAGVLPLLHAVSEGDVRGTAADRVHAVAAGVIRHVDHETLALAAGDRRVVDLTHRATVDEFADCRAC